MRNKKTNLTSDELGDLIAESVKKAMNEIDTRTYARVHDTTRRAQEQNQKGIYMHQVNAKKSESNDSIIKRGIELEPRAADSLLSRFKDTRFMFYCRNLRQNVGITLFKPESLFELTGERAVLKGDIAFNYERMNGSIIISMKDGAAIYYHSPSRRKYPLEIDNRFSEQWNELVGTLQEAARLISK